MPGFATGVTTPVNDGHTHAEYKQVTVLFADVVHSVNLAAALYIERLREIMTETRGAHRSPGAPLGSAFQSGGDCAGSVVEPAYNLRSSC
jgi:hypothetical protein